MAEFSNGRWPLDRFILLRSGVDGDGYWEHRITAGTRDKLERLQQRAYDRTGRWLALSSGWSAYRPLTAQFQYQSIYGNGAATPGTSSHGLYWEGRVCLALDIGNWSDVYDGNREAFYADCRAVGLEPGLISRERGYPDEPWHVIDFDPFRYVPPQPAPEPEKKPQRKSRRDKDMILIRWNAKHIFGIVDGAVSYVPTIARLGALAKSYGEPVDVDNPGLEAHLVHNGIHWDAVDAVLRGAGQGPDGRYWSKTAAEGEAIRGKQDAVTKTINDVLATAKSIEAAA